MILPKRMLGPFIWSLALVACSPFSSYRDILEDPTVLKRSTSGEVARYSITFQPVWLKPYAVQKELTEENTFDHLLTEYGNHLNFVLEVTLRNSRNEMELTTDYLKKHLQFKHGETQWPISFLQEEQAGMAGLKRFLVSCELPIANGQLEDDLDIELSIAAEDQKTQQFHFTKNEINHINLING